MREGKKRACKLMCINTHVFSLFFFCCFAFSCIGQKKPAGLPYSVRQIFPVMTKIFCLGHPTSSSLDLWLSLDLQYNVSVCVCAHVFVLVCSGTSILAYAETTQQVTSAVYRDLFILYETIMFAVLGIIKKQVNHQFIC